MPGTHIAYGASCPLGTRSPGVAVMYVHYICLRFCCAMLGTDKAYGAILQPACYAMSGTEKAYQLLWPHAVAAIRPS
eukprot:626145-Rhodomonas_salina.5